MNPMRRLFIVILLILPAGCRHAAAPARILTAVRVTEAKTAQRALASSVHYSGSVIADRSVEVCFKVGGYVQAIQQVNGIGSGKRALQPGDAVQIGEKLAWLRTSDYRPQIAEALAGVEETHAGILSAQAQQRRARAGLSQSKAALLGGRSQLLQAQTMQSLAEQQLKSAQIAILQANNRKRDAIFGKGESEAEVQSASAGFTKANQDFRRASALYHSFSLTRPDYDAAKTAYEAALASLNEAKERQKQAANQVDLAEERIALAANQAEQAKLQKKIAIEKMLQAAQEAAVYRARVIQASSQLQETYEGLKAAKAKLIASQALLHQANIPLKDTILVSPMDGIVLNRYIEIGSLAAPDSPAFSIADTREVKVVFGAPEQLLSFIRLGMSVPIFTDSPEHRKMFGIITSIAPSADQRTRVFSVEASVPNLNGRLKIGMIVTLKIPDRLPPAGVLVPAAALISSPDHPGEYALFVVVKSGNVLIVKLRDVKAPAAAYGNSVAVQGILPDDLVVTTGASRVRDGEAVRVLGENSEGEADGAYNG